MNIIKKLSLFTIAVATFFVASCADGSEAVATSGTLQVIIDVTNPESWPEDGTVFCSLDKTWPPSGAPYLTSTLESSMINDDGQIILQWSLINFDTYKLISVSWRDPDNPNPACNQAVWGTHSGSAQAFYADASPIDLSSENSTLSFDIAAIANTATPPCPPG